MSLTIRQHHIVTHLPELQVRTRQTGRQGYSLGGSDVTATIHSLIVKEIIAKEAGGRRVVLTKNGQAKLGVFAT